MQVSKWGNSLAVVGDDLEIVEASKDKVAVRKADRRAEALARMAARRWTLPTDYRFDRNDAKDRNER
jgi:antitoxin MazE